MADTELLDNVDTTGGDTTEVEDTSSNEPSLTDTIREAVRLHKSSSNEDNVEGNSKNTGKERDKSGKFTTNKPTTPHPTENTATTQVQDHNQNQQVVHNTGLSAPGGWSKEAQADFSKLPPHVQQAIAIREQQVSNGFKVLQNYKDLDQFQSYIDQEKQINPNYSFATLVKEAIQWAEAAQANPIGTILHLAKGKGLNPQQLIAAIQNPQYAAQFRKQVSRPQPKTISPDEYRAMAREEYAKVQQEAGINNTVSDFLSDPKYPHANKVVDDMVMFINSNKAQDLPTAYQMALRLHPELSQNTTQNNGLRPSVNQAKRASKAVTGAPKTNVASTGKSQQYSNVRDAVKAAIELHK